MQVEIRTIGISANLVDNLGMGVEFQQIRRGDRPVLEYVLGKVKTRRVEEFARVEVTNEPISVAV